jgi:hypothetical protein
LLDWAEAVAWSSSRVGGAASLASAASSGSWAITGFDQSRQPTIAHKDKHSAEQMVNRDAQHEAMHDIDRKAKRHAKHDATQAASGSAERMCVREGLIVPGAHQRVGGACAR